MPRSAPRSPSLSLGLVAALTLPGLACTDRPGVQSASETSSSSTGTDPGTGTGAATTEPAPTSSAGTSTITTTTSTSENTSEPATGSSDESGCPSAMVLESPPNPEQCKIGGNDCLPCQKCAPVYMGEGTRCVPLAPDPAQPGEECVAESGNLEGHDDCAAGAYCWNLDPGGMGVCEALCAVEDPPSCADPGKLCVEIYWYFDLCLERCDPLIGDCSDPGAICVAQAQQQGFVCAPDSSDLENPVHEPCDTPDTCADGLACLPSAMAAECDPNFQNCCLAICDLTLPDPNSQCSGAGQECLPFFGDQPPPAGDEDVGVCAIPG